MVLTKGQEQGLKVAVKRYRNHEPYTVIAGYSGVGKSSLVRFIIEALNLDENERNEMFDLAGRERNQVSPDLPEYIMDEALPSARVALRRAKNQSLGDDFWQEVNKIIDKRNGGH